MKSSKGSKFERDTCRLFSLWFSDGERDDLFWRSAGSGAMAKSRSRKGKGTFGQYGDIQATDPIGQVLMDVFTIELKRGYNAASFMEMMDKPQQAAPQMWERFYAQVKEDYKNSKSKYWMIVWRRDRRETLVYFPTSFVTCLNEFSFSCKEKWRKIPSMSSIVRLKNGKRLKVSSCALSDFLKVVSPEIIKGISK